MAEKKYTDAALLVGTGSAGRIFCQICFWLWGLAGLIFLSPGIPGLPGSRGSPGFLLYWIGGMLPFGAGGLLAGSYYDFKRPIEPVKPSV